MLGARFELPDRGGGGQLARLDPPALLAQRRNLPEALGEVSDAGELGGSVMLGESIEGVALLGARAALGELKLKRVGEHRAERQQRPVFRVRQLALGLERDRKRRGGGLAEALDSPAAVAPAVQVLA